MSDKTNWNEDNISFFNNGYVIVDFENTDYIDIIQQQIKHCFNLNPVELHCNTMNDDQRLQLIKKAKDVLVENEVVKHLLFSNADTFRRLLGPDIDIQSDIHLRVSRPNQEGDLISWHRDTFYGNTHWELNFWFPIFPLEEGAGLVVVENSHLMPAKKIHHIEDENPFRKQVKKGSIANEIGFVYAPKCDDTILNIEKEKTKLLSPKVGQAVFFFGHMVHRAQNLSTKTRISIDVRIKNMLAPTNTKPGYYQPLIRSDIAKYVEKIQIMEMENEAMCGN